MSKDMVIIPKKLNGIDAMAIAICLQGKWSKMDGEKDTERVKRIYSTFINVMGENGYE